MSLREDIFQAAVNAMDSTGLCVLARRYVPTQDDELPAVMVRPEVTTRTSISYGTVENKTRIVFITVAEDVTEVEAAAAALLAALESATGLWSLIEGAELVAVTEDTELAKLQITHQRFDYVVTYNTQGHSY